APVMRQHEGRRVIGRVLAPPAFPALVRPGSAHRAEHVAAEDEGTEPIHRAMRVALVDAIGAAVLADHRPEAPGAEEPLKQLLPALAQRVLEALLRSGAEPVEGEGKSGDAYLGHSISFY